VVAGHQQVTREWWAGRSDFELFVSDAVVEEISRGDPAAASKRLAVVDGISVLSPVPEALELARNFISGAAMPAKAAIDATHVALAAVHGMDFLLTWNCTHIANAVMRPQLEDIC
jgi:hypothetical protein